MFSPSHNFYATWRLRPGAMVVLREGDLPNERLLQMIWQHQRLRRDQLKTTDGKIIRVLHPGFISVEGGADFCNAIIQIGDEPPRSGDVEIDLRSNGWRAHGHETNPAFQNVILHVVWQNDGITNSSLTRMINRPLTLVLHNFLDAPFGELSLLLENEPLRSLPENLRGKCSAPLRELNETQLMELLREAALVRFQSKAEQFRVRARHVGWEQSLWEGLFRALGYKHNVWPMQNLAERRSRWMNGSNSAFELQARLLGIGGLLPAELTRAQKSADNYLRRAWDFWWRERDQFNDCVLPRAVWKFHGLRPANHPQRRLALAAHWLADKKLISKIENWCAAEIADKKLLDSLLKIFQVANDEFWSWHWAFRSVRLERAQPLLGEARLTDLAVNAILPWLWMRAAEGKNRKLQQIVEHRYFAWPSTEDNSVLKLARQRLLGGGRNRTLNSAAAQQGLIQIVRDFCEHSNAICEDCRFPELVRNWNARTTI